MIDQSTVDASTEEWLEELEQKMNYDHWFCAPTQAITREELATMLYRYAKYSKLDTSAKGDLSKFADGDQIAAWASDAMAWAVGAGLISGKTANVIDPTGTATRAEVATILMRFTELTK